MLNDSNVFSGISVSVPLCAIIIGVESKISFVFIGFQKKMYLIPMAIIITATRTFRCDKVQPDHGSADYYKDLIVLWVKPCAYGLRC